MLVSTREETRRRHEPSGADYALLYSETVARLMDARQFLDIDVQQVTGSGMFIADDGSRGFEHVGLIQSQAGQDAADGSAAQAGGLRDAQSRPALAALDAGGQFGGSGAR